MTKPAFITHPTRAAWPSAAGWLLLAAAALAQPVGDRLAKRVAVEPSAAGAKRFELIPPSASGIQFTNRLTGLEFYKNMVAHNGAGVAVGDVNGDGLADIYLCNIQDANALYLNRGGFRFRTTGQADGIGCADTMSTGAALADVDNDGDNDLLVNGIQSGTRLFLNDGTGGFVLNEQSGLDTAGTSTSMALADIDGDGDLDLYVANYIDWMHLADPTTRFEYSRRGEQWVVTRVNGESALKPRWKGRFTVSSAGRVREVPEADRLYLNNGDGTFRDVSDEPMFVIDGEPRALASFREWGLAVTFRDVNNDLLPDLYVCNDFASPDRFWINRGDGTFRLATHRNVRHTSRSTMGVDFTDLNADGVPDFMLLDMLDPDRARRLVQLEKEVERSSRLLDWTFVPRFNRNVLMVSQGGQQWFDTAHYSGVAASGWSWNVRFIDADLDGDDDMLVTNGFAFDTMDMDASLQIKAAQKTSRNDARTLYEMKKLQPRYNSPNRLYRNEGRLRFADAGAELGFAHDGITHGLGVGDLDNDGDLDLVTNNLNEPPSLYRNTSQEPRLQVRLPRGGVGSKVRLETPGGAVTREIVSGGGYLSSDSGEVVFAAGRLGQAAALVIEWRDGSVPTRIERPSANSIYTVTKPPLAKHVVKREPAKPKPMFRELPGAISFRHLPALAKDFDENPLLFKRLSMTAPPMLCRDFDGDGWLDVGFQLARDAGVQVFLNRDGSRFQPVAARYSDPSGWMANAGWLDGFAVADGKPSFAAALNQTIPPLGLLTQPAALVLRGDVDGDGTADAIFITQNRLHDHPVDSQAVVLLNRAGTFRRAAGWERSLGALGQVSSAVLVDMDADGDADLLVSRDLGSIGLFDNRGDRFVDISGPAGLARFTGMWQGLAVGDFDNDGRADFAAGNLGRNSPMEPYCDALVHLGRGGESRLSLFALKRGDVFLPVDDMDLVSRVVDRARLPRTHREFSGIDLATVLESFDGLKQTRLNCFESSVFLNRGGTFERRALPYPAQWSPASGINVADFDNDGRDDLLLSQNWYSLRPDLGRLDSSAGLVLLGQGDGGFEPVSSGRSGLAILGDSRNASVADFNRDGRADIVATQTLGQALVYLGQAGKRGIRISFNDNAPLAKRLSATVRLVYPDGSTSPRRWFHSGDGVLAQCAPRQVLGFAQWPDSIRIEWPGGVNQVIPVLPNKNDYVVP
ncbi:MAG: hypothetical protein ACI8QI_000792 [Limisphaerales bacterium]